MALAAAFIRPDARGPRLQVRGLRVELERGDEVVSDVTFHAAAGEILGLVGESGSGKTTIASALLAHLRRGARITQGSVHIDDLDVLNLGPAELERVRGKVVGYVAQDPATALNPILRIGTQLFEGLAVHEPALARSARLERVLATLEAVELPTDPELLRRFPHQLSGGQQQRVLLALTFVLRPKLIVLDEPTTALDVATRTKILGTVRRLCRSHDVAAVYVSHDLGVVQDLVDRVIVLYAGRIAEAGPRDALFSHPRHPYTQGLLAAIPEGRRLRALPVPIAGQHPAPGTRPAGCAFAPRCARRADDCTRETPVLSSVTEHRAACFHPLSEPPAASYRLDGSAPRPLDIRRSAPAPLLSVRHLGAAYGRRQVLFDVTFDLREGECLALVGASGSGKTTLARAVAGLGERISGEFTYGGRPLQVNVRARTADVRRQIQYVFQNPYRALNPRRTIRQTLRSAVRHCFHLDKSGEEAHALAAIQRVALPPEILDGYPDELSGGERQRVAIARALVCRPRLLICDEITSALDVSVQAAVLRLLASLQENGLSLLFVTHDLAVVRAVADRMLVLDRGRVTATGPVAAVLAKAPSPSPRPDMKDALPA